MITLILPGGSSHNKIWADSMQQKLAPDIQTTVIYWRHWITEKKSPTWIESEAKKVIDHYNEPVSIIAKSIGTVVALQILKKKPTLIHKLILNGIPLHDIENAFAIYEPLAIFPMTHLLVLQNDNDPHGTYKELVTVLHRINPVISIVKKTRDDHEYPYSEDFREFLR